MATKFKENDIGMSIEIFIFERPSNIRPNSLGSGVAMIIEPIIGAIHFMNPR